MLAQAASPAETPEEKQPKPETPKQALAEERRAKAREQCLEQAYAHLRETRGTFHYLLLAEQAHVRSETARLWLKQREAQDKLLSSAMPSGLPEEGVCSLS